MVVLSAAVCTRSGKALLSRQFVEMTRMRIEGLLAAFPKLISSESGKQHTFIETDNVRYLYLPLEAALYLLLITNKASNIIEDLDTLRLLSKVVPEQVGTPITEEVVSARAFELLFALDEVVAAGGYREDVNLHAIRTNLEMESHEEKLAQMIKASKMAEAKEAAKRKALEIRERTREEEKLARAGFGNAGPAGGRMTGFGSGPGGGSYDEFRSGGYSGAARAPGYSSSPATLVELSPAATAAAARKTAPAGGMKLGSKKGAGGGAGSLGLAGAVMAEEGLRGIDSFADSSAGPLSAAATVSAAAASAAAAAADLAVVAIEETLVVRLSRDGGCKSLDVKGTLSLTVHDEASARLKLCLRKGDTSGFTFTCHPNINKAAFGTDGVLALKQPDRPFPVGSPIGVLRWRLQAKDEDASVVPLSINCWPEEVGGGKVNVNIEYTLHNEALTLNDVVVSVPLGSSDAVPNVVQCDGVYKHNTRENTLQWRIESVSASNASGGLEFAVSGRGINADSFFPVTITFSSTDTLCPLELADILPVDADAATGKSLRHSATKSLTVESYSVEAE